jgi:hypothetical protein
LNRKVVGGLLALGAGLAWSGPAKASGPTWGGEEYDPVGETVLVDGVNFGVSGAGYYFGLEHNGTFTSAYAAAYTNSEGGLTGNIPVAGVAAGSYNACLIAGIFPVACDPNTAAVTIDRTPRLALTQDTPGYPMNYWIAHMPSDFFEVVEVDLTAGQVVAASTPALNQYGGAYLTTIDVPAIGGHTYELRALGRIWRGRWVTFVIATSPTSTSHLPG